MSTRTDRRIDTPEVAKMLRKTLKAEFPGQKFSVRSSRYAGGSSIDVIYTDGPMQSTVQEVCWRYAGASFDGMTDMKSYHDSLVSTEDGAEVVHFGADFVHAQRRISDEWRAELEVEVSDFTGEPFANNRHYAASGHWGELAHDSHRGEWGSQLIYQLSAKRDRKGGE